MANENNEAFDLFEFMSGQNYPSDTVSVYTDADAAYKFRQNTNDIKRGKIELQRLELKDDQKNIKVLKKLISDAEKENVELRERANKSKLTVTLRGAPQHVINEIRDRYGDTNDDNGKFMNDLVATLLESVETADGKRDTRVWSPDDVEKFQGLLMPSEWLKVVTAVNELLLLSAAFEGDTDSGFLANS